MAAYFSISARFKAKFELVFSLNLGEHFFLRDFILKPTETDDMFLYDIHWKFEKFSIL